MSWPKWQPSRRSLVYESHHWGLDHVTPVDQLANAMRGRSSGRPVWMGAANA